MPQHVMKPRFSQHGGTSPRVDTLWVHEAGAAVRATVPADGCIDLIVRLPATGVVSARVLPPTSNALDVRIPRDEQMLGIRLRAGYGMPAFMNGATKLAFANEQLVPSAQLFEPNRPDRRAAGIEVAFVVPNVEAAYEAAVAAGAFEAAKPEEKPWGQTVSYVRDPNGVLIELCSEVPR